MFESANRLKLRFPYKGNCSVEDLWDLTMGQLDEVYKKVNSELRLNTEDSLLQIKTTNMELLELKISIIKHIVEVKNREAEAKTLALQKSQQKQRILAIIAEKEQAGLYDKSIDELKTLLK